MTDNTNRRREERLPHRAVATLVGERETYTAHLINISKGGALIAIIDGHTLQANDSARLEVQTKHGNFTLQASIAHVKSHYLGLKCDPVAEKDKKVVEATIEELKSHNRLAV